MLAARLHMLCQLQCWVSVGGCRQILTTVMKPLWAVGPNTFPGTLCWPFGVKLQVCSQCLLPSAKNSRWG